ncbi:unnamed protein product [Cylicocyclus nassatus]|uniref:Uncharacterized protein n=1 Tax=Cylicocyclus nassatus TaxID=53992 RepID=A0AA36DKC8_CYLNA|nr:unnamed protein product [Cylicocyclus nassatus]
MLIKCLLLCFVINSAMSGPVYIDELEDLVAEGPDRYELKMLDRNKQMIRSEKQQRLNEILARQTPYIQQAYSAKVLYEMNKRIAKAQYEQQMANLRGHGNFAAQMNAIRNDMSISSAEADRRKKELRRQYYAAYPSAREIA